MKKVFQIFVSAFIVSCAIFFLIYAFLVPQNCNGIDKEFIHCHVIDNMFLSVCGGVLVFFGLQWFAYRISPLTPEYDNKAVFVYPILVALIGFALILL